MVNNDNEDQSAAGLAFWQRASQAPAAPASQEQQPPAPVNAGQIEQLSDAEYEANRHLLGIPDTAALFGEQHFRPGPSAYSYGARDRGRGVAHRSSLRRNDRENDQ
jgi:hypothetical protein